MTLVLRKSECKSERPSDNETDRAIKPGAPLPKRCASRFTREPSAALRTRPRAPADSVCLQACCGLGCDGLPVACTTDAALRAAGVGRKRAVRCLRRRLRRQLLTRTRRPAGVASTTPENTSGPRALRPRAPHRAARATLWTTTACAWAPGQQTLHTRRACLRSGGACHAPTSLSSLTPDAPAAAATSSWAGRP